VYTFFPKLKPAAAVARTALELNGGLPVGGRRGGGGYFIGFAAAAFAAAGGFLPAYRPPAAPAKVAQSRQEKKQNQELLCHEKASGLVSGQ
jgi:hypothetical protein